MLKNSFTQSGANASISLAISDYMRGVYAWMCGGLILTAISAWFTASSPAMLELIFGNTFVMIALVIAQFSVVIALSAAIHKMSSEMATALFIGYAILTGLTLSSIFIVYEMGSIAVAFFSTAGMFGAMSIYGLVTKRNLDAMGRFMMMGLFGIIIAMLLNFFMKSSTVDWVVSCLGVVIFAGLTAWDTQKLEAFGRQAPINDAVAIRRGTILGALTLYLDFINLFLMLLRLFGNRR